jgi:hypothetical protein
VVYDGDMHERMACKDVLHKQGLNVQLSKGSSHLNIYYYNINNITFTVYIFISIVVHPDDV